MAEHEGKDEVEEVHAGHDAGHGHDDHGHGKKDDHGHTKPADKNHGKKAKGVASNIIEFIVDTIVAHIRGSIIKTSRFVAFGISLFFLGALFGFFLPHLADRLGISASMLLVVPLILAALAMLPFLTDVVLIIFILLLLAVLLFA